MLWYYFAGEMKDMYIYIYTTHTHTHTHLIVRIPTEHTVSGDVVV
jgi:hypothetical protein